MASLSGIESTKFIIEKLRKFNSKSVGDVHAVLLIRHAERPALDASTGVGFDVPLTEEGKANSRKLGEFLNKSGLKCGKLYSSPFVRCLETTQSIAEGAGWNPEEIEIRFELLGYNTIYHEVRTAGASIVRLSAMGSINTWLDGNIPEGFFPLDEGTDKLWDYMKKVIPGEDTVGEDGGHVYLSVLTAHDTILAPLIHKFFLKKHFDDESWPKFMESVLLVKSDSDLKLYWRDSEVSVT